MRCVPLNGIQSPLPLIEHRHRLAQRAQGLAEQVHLLTLLLLLHPCITDDALGIDASLQVLQVPALLLLRVVINLHF